MPDKKCPNCGLWNSQAAIRCDCGFDFVTKKIEGSYIIENREAPKPSLQSPAPLAPSGLKKQVTGFDPKNQLNSNAAISGQGQLIKSGKSQTKSAQPIITFIFIVCIFLDIIFVFSNAGYFLGILGNRQYTFVNPSAEFAGNFLTCGGPALILTLVSGWKIFKKK